MIPMLFILATDNISYHTSILYVFSLKYVYILKPRERN